MDNGHVWFSKIGEIRTFMHRSVTGDIRTVSVKHDSVGDWFITMAVGTDSNNNSNPDKSDGYILNLYVLMNLLLPDPAADYKYLARFHPLSCERGIPARNC